MHMDSFLFIHLVVLPLFNLHKCNNTVIVFSSQSQYVSILGDISCLILKQLMLTSVFYCKCIYLLHI